MNIDLLRKEIEKVIGQKLKASGDYELLSLLVMERTHRRLSPTTLKRLFGYLPAEAVTPRASTLDALARFVGYDDAEHFCRCCGSTEPQSCFINREQFCASDLKEGSLLVLTWNPGRRCIVRHLGDARFEVAEAENCKLQVGDTFTCNVFVCNEPLYVTDVVRSSGEKMGGYVAGQNDGVMVSLVHTCAHI